MNIIYEMIKNVNESFNSEKEEILDAMLVGPKYMNLMMNQCDIENILLFSGKIEQCPSPDFKSIYSKEINDGIWSIVCWTIKTKKMMDQLSDFLNQYLDIKVRIMVNYEMDNQFIIKCFDINNNVLFKEKLNSFFGKGLFIEVATILYRKII